VNFETVKLFYVFSCVALCLVILSPTLLAIVSFPEGEKFSEMWLLGPTHMMEGYPFHVSPRASYHVFLGVGNQMGGLEYYSLQVKLRNESEPVPDNSAGTPSGLPTVYDYRFFLRNSATWEKEFSFSFQDVAFEGNVCRISKILIDDHVVNVGKTAVQDEGDKGFYYQVFFELWIYNTTSSAFQFHNRWVGFWLNMSR
jgi:hypothetical protein